MNHFNRIFRWLRKYWFAIVANVVFLALVCLVAISSNRRIKDEDAKALQEGLYVESSLSLDKPLDRRTVQIIHDTKHQVTCWRGQDLSGCLPDRDVKR